MGSSNHSATLRIHQWCGIGQLAVTLHVNIFTQCCQLCEEREYAVLSSRALIAGTGSLEVPEFPKREYSIQTALTVLAGNFAHLRIGFPATATFTPPRVGHTANYKRIS